MNRLVTFFLLSGFLFLSSGCIISSDDSSNISNTSSQNSSSTLTSNLEDLGYGHAFLLPSGWEVTDRVEEKTQNLSTPSGGTEIRTTIHQISSDDPFDPAVVFRTFTINASLDAREVARLEPISCEKPNSFEELNMNTLPAYVVTVSSDFCEDGTEISFRKYYTFKKQGDPNSLMAIFYTESESDYKQLQNDFDRILSSISYSPNTTTTRDEPIQNGVSSTVSWKMYTDDTLDYVLRYPNDWQVSDEDYQFTQQTLASSILSHRLFFLPYPKPAAWPKVEIGVAVYNVPQTYSLEDIMRHDEDIVEGTGGNGSYTSDQPENVTRLKVDGHDALRYEFNNPIEGGPQIELLIRKEEIIYDVEVSAGDSETFAQWKTTLEQMISDFHVTL